AVLGEPGRQGIAADGAVADADPRELGAACVRCQSREEESTDKRKEKFSHEHRRDPFFWGMSLSVKIATGGAAPRRFDCCFIAARSLQNKQLTYTRYYGAVHGATIRQQFRHAKGPQGRRRELRYFQPARFGESRFQKYRAPAGFVESSARESAAARRQPPRQQSGYSSAGQLGSEGQAGQGNRLHAGAR